MSFDLTDQVVVVTGASGGLGGAVARALLDAGARLALVERNAEKLAAAAQRLDPGGGSTFTHRCDLGDAPAVEAMAAAVLDRFGRIDGLVNLAGGFRGGVAVHETPLADWDAMLDQNARPLFHLARAVVPAMIARRRGTIVAVASRAALAGGAGVAPYSASKAAVVRLTESLAAELAPHGIRANAILPSTIDTPANRAAMPDADHRAWVAPAALADLVVFLVSEASRAVNGAAIPA